MSTAPAELVLIAGGERDPNLRALAAALDRLGVAHHDLLVGRARHPAITWALDDDTLVIDGAPLRPSALFLRHDVFEHLADPRPETSFRAVAWSTAIAGWALAHPHVRWFNRASQQRRTNKLHALHLARAAGLEIPRTRVTNDLAALADDVPLVAKPVDGGGPCRRLAELLPSTPTHRGRAAAPAIVQPELVPPERRIFAVRRSLTTAGAGPAPGGPIDTCSSSRPPWRS